MRQARGNEIVNLENTLDLAYSVRRVWSSLRQALNRGASDARNHQSELAETQPHQSDQA
jgi:hypothetical protein